MLPDVGRSLGMPKSTQKAYKAALLIPEAFAIMPISVGLERLALLSLLLFAASIDGDHVPPRLSAQVGARYEAGVAVLKSHPCD